MDVIVRNETVPTDVQQCQGNPDNLSKVAFTARVSTRFEV